MDTWIYASAGSGGTSEYGPKYFQVSIGSLTAQRYFRVLGAAVLMPGISGYNKLY
ncbi:hypothetical protein PENANT_c008G04799 [Penicillium antarcticum]|uniref:Uncharacterized protein n=1 Tax=Penicillium antarcticum TaxID=416450 RepID=A0A1V6QAF1_9EURO|nr:hypothetical protein PENANT_c008G04799 [Penicillium antarcticum]